MLQQRTRSRLPDWRVEGRRRLDRLHQRHLYVLEGSQSLSGRDTHCDLVHRPVHPTQHSSLPALYSSNMSTGLLLDLTSYKLEYLCCSLSYVLDVLGNDWPQFTVMWFCGNAFSYQIVLSLLQADENISEKIPSILNGRLTFSPCCFSNLYHHAQRSPLSGSAFAARLSHNLVFSIFRSFQNNLPTALMTSGCSLDFLIASTERPLRCCAASIQIAMLHSKPELGQSCWAAK